jgi:inorganic pyrophosphatase
MTREQLNTQLTEMWDAVSLIDGDDAHAAVEQAYKVEDKLRKQFDEQERIRDAAPELLAALEGCVSLFAALERLGEVGVKDSETYRNAKDAIKKARG